MPLTARCEVFSSGESDAEDLDIEAEPTPNMIGQLTMN